MKSQSSDSSTQGVVTKRTFRMIPRSGILTLSTIALIVASFGVYYFVIAENQADYLTRRNLRQLYVVSKNTSMMLSGFATAAHSWISRIRDPSQFFDRVVSVQTADPANTHKTAKKHEEIALFASNDTLWLKYRDTVAIGSRKDSSSRREFLKMIRLPLPKDPEILKDLFDLVLVIDSTGHVLLEDDISKTGIFIISLDSLISAEGARFPVYLASKSTGVSGFEIAGKRYRAFYQPLQISSALQPKRGPWLIVGLTRLDRFRDQSLKMPFDSLILLGFLILVAVMTWPLAKLALMGRKDALRPVEVFFVVLSGLLGASLITVLIADFFCIQYSLTAESNEQLRRLADQVESNFRAELNSALFQLRDFNTAANQRSQTSDSIRLGILASTDCYPRRYPSLDAFYEIDASGLEVMRWSVQDHASPLLHLKDREYFKNVSEGRLWHILMDPRDSSDFWLEPHLSRTTGRFETTLAIPATVKNQEKGVCALSTGPWSLFQTTVVLGFGYCVIDDQGKVLYHSDESRNLSEDFFEECDQNPDLVTAVRARVAGWARANYWGAMHTLYVKPIRDIPWSIVAFRDESYLKAANLETVTVAMLLFFIYAILLLATFALFHFRGRRQAEWIWPVNAQKNNYIRLAFFFLFICFVFLLMRTFNASVDHIIIVTFIMPSITIGVSYLTLHNSPGWIGLHPRRIPGEILMFASIPALLLLLTFVHSTGWLPWCICASSLALGLLITQSEKVAVFLRREWLRCFVLWMIVYVVATVLPLEILPAAGTAGSVLGLLLGVVIGLVIWWATPRLKEMPLPDFRLCYIVTATAFLLLAAGQPSLNFFKIACDVQLELLVKHEQLHLALDLEERSDRLSARYARIPGADSTFKRRLRDTSDVYDAFFFDTKYPVESAKSLPASANFTDSVIIPKLMPKYDEISTHTRGMMASSSTDGLWHWNRSGADSLICFSKRDLTSFRGARDSYSMSTVAPGYIRQLKLLPLHMWTLLVTAICAVIISLFLLVKFIVKRVLLIDAAEPASLYSTVQVLRADARNVLVLAPSSTVREELLEDKRTIVIDMMKQRDIRDWREIASLSPDRVLVIDHFEFIDDNAHADHERLAFLEELVNSLQRKVVLLSSVDPLTRFGATPSQASMETPTAPENNYELDRWRTLLNSFVTTRITATTKSSGFPEKLSARIPLDRGPRWTRMRLAGLRRSVEDECGEDPNLQRIGLMVLDDFDDVRQNGATREDFHRRMLEAARTYYFQIWRICSPDQRRVLVHLARHGYVNWKNRLFVEQLMRVGLVRRTPALRVMNETFRRFVLEVRQPSDTAISAEDARRSVWGMSRVPMIIIVFSVAGFLFLTQRDVMDSTTALLTAAAGVLPALLRLFGLFKSDTAVTADGP